ncbi:MAG: ABC transporter substrate-binding protein [Brevinemataceae bacterium]
MRRLLLLSLLLVVSCGQKKDVLEILIWTGNIPQDVYADFTKETGIKVVESAMSSNEEAYAKIKASSVGFDIVTPSLDYAEIMVKEGLAYALNRNNILNITNIDPIVMKHIQLIDPEGRYIIPFTFGPTIIAYDKTKVSNEVKGFNIFNDPAYKGKMSLLNDMREVMGSALLTLGYTVDTTNETAMQEVQQLLKLWKQNILRFDADAFHIAYANGEVDIVHGYPGTIIPNLSPEKYSNTVFVIPDKGGMMWADNFLVLKDAPNKEGAEKFINFIHRPDIYARIINYIQSVSLNVPAREYIVIEAPFSYEDLNRLEMLRAVDDNVLSIHSRIWENIQAQ